VNFLLRLSRAIDALNERVGHLVYWLILAAVVLLAWSVIGVLILTNAFARMAGLFTFFI